MAEDYFGQELDQPVDAEELGIADPGVGSEVFDAEPNTLCWLGSGSNRRSYRPGARACVTREIWQGQRDGSWTNLRQRC